jgi:hypothetical protein
VVNGVRISETRSLKSESEPRVLATGEAKRAWAADVWRGVLGAGTAACIGRLRDRVRRTTRTTGAEIWAS